MSTACLQRFPCLPLQGCEFAVSHRRGHQRKPEGRLVLGASLAPCQRSEVLRSVDGLGSEEAPNLVAVGKKDTVLAAARGNHPVRRVI